MVEMVELNFDGEGKREVKEVVMMVILKFEVGVVTVVRVKMVVMEREVKEVVVKEELRCWWN